MTSALFLGAGASPGVPSLSNGWGACNPDNPKNIRRRTSTLYEINGVKILIDTSPDLRMQLLDNRITALDGICYTHAHSDHLYGIDELRDIHRSTSRPLDVSATPVTMREIRRRFSYLLLDKKTDEFYLSRPGLLPHVIRPNHAFDIKGVKIMPLKLLGHNMPSFGYILNDEIVHVADFKYLAGSAEERIAAVKPKLMVLPLTIVNKHRYHIGLEEALGYIEKFNPERVVLNHMASECDYDFVEAHTPENVHPAYDNLKLEW